ncbi:MAG: hypothetical protein IJ899_02685 [Blautia sp.]|nr:hypothetical protein [Blautia sp.]
MIDNGEIFVLRARICKRCGRILTKAESVERGLGCQCAKKEKAAETEKTPIPGQVDVYEWLKSNESN